MSQNNLVIANQSGAGYRGAVNNALNSLVTLNSGASAPTTTYAQMLWLDTATNTLKKRDASDAAWVNLTAVGGADQQSGGGRVENAQTGTTYTLALTDAQGFVSLSNASAITLTIPANATVAFPVGTEIDVAQLGAGQVTFSPAGGVTLNSYASKVSLAGQFAGGTLKKTATNTWLLVGNLA